MTDKQKIRAEIERRMKTCEEAFNACPSTAFGSRIDSYKALLSFIDSLPEEPVSEGIENELERFAYSLPHSADGFWPKDIDPKSVEARTKYGVHHYWSYEQVMNIARHFAEWGRNHFEDKSEMVSEETTIVNDWQYGKDQDHAVIPAIHQRIEGFNVGDKVKIIIIKEEEK